jgi:hypothetical protein
MLPAASQVGGSVWRFGQARRLCLLPPGADRPIVRLSQWRKDGESQDYLNQPRPTAQGTLAYIAESSPVVADDDALQPAVRIRALRVLDASAV